MVAITPEALVTAVLSPLVVLTTAGLRHLSDQVRCIGNGTTHNYLTEKDHKVDLHTHSPENTI